MLSPAAELAASSVGRGTGSGFGTGTGTGTGSGTGTGTGSGRVGLVLGVAAAAAASLKRCGTQGLAAAAELAASSLVAAARLAARRGTPVLAAEAVPSNGEVALAKPAPERTMYELRTASLVWMQAR